MSDLVGMMAPRRAAPLPTDRPLNILVANLAHLGDLIILLPLLARLRASKRTAQLGLLIGSWGRAALELGDFADVVHVVDHWRLNRGEASLTTKIRRHAGTRAAAVPEMRRQVYDVAIDTYAYFGNSADLLWSVGAPMRIGFTSGGAGTLYTHRLSFDPRLSMSGNQSRLLEPMLGAPSTWDAQAAGLPGFQPDPEVERLADTLGACVVLHIGPGATHKDWPAAQWIALGHRLRADGFHLVFTGAAGESAHGEGVRQSLGGTNLLGRLSLRGFATLLRRARGLATIDTVAAHLAACFEVPTVIVQPGITPPNLWRPNQPYVAPVTHSVPCAPCHLTHGCAAMTCIRSVPAEALYAALVEVMSAKAAR
ncbi:MAG: glycosyltransferase family 9 protein [Hyphomonadaceae bacterium]|nr:glycosyltransferase family 9 protein [Hyphomonadaceae bacterium]